jgi:hypothetical protein
VVAILAVVACAVWVVAQQNAVTPRPLATLFPANALLYVEAKNFRSLLNDWNGSREKPLWLASDNNKAWAVSNLAQKLARAQTEFAAAAGVPPDMALLSDVAGTESGLALYDIGELQFLYVTHLPSARFANSALAKTRGNYEPRRSADLDYYVRVDKASRRVAAWATTQDYLLLATREDVLAGALALLAGKGGFNVAQEPWFAKSVQAQPAQGELRLVMNLERLVQTPYVRSYWVQRNVGELRQFDAAIVDAERSSGDWREHRTLFRHNTEPAASNEAAIAQVVRLVPDDAGFYRAWASPTGEQAFALLRQKIFEPQPGAGAAGNAAPPAASLDANVGSEADLETRIDEPPIETGAQGVPAEVEKWLNGVQIQGILEVGTSRALAGGVFVGIDSAVALLAATPWDLAAARSALSSAAASQWTTGGAGTQWLERKAGAQAYYELSGPVGLSMAAMGETLVVATRPELMAAILANGAKGPSTITGRYAASYRHAREYPNFVRLARLIDNPLRTDGVMFFSGNLASLGRTLGRVESASIVARDTGATETEQVVYHFRP